MRAKLTDGCWGEIRSSDDPPDRGQPVPAWSVRSIPIDRDPRAAGRKSMRPLAFAGSNRRARGFNWDFSGCVLILTECIGEGMDQSAFYRPGNRASGSWSAACGGSRGDGDCAGRTGPRNRLTGQADQPESDQRFRNCCRQGAEMPAENASAIRPSFTTPRTVPLSTLWRRQTSPTSARKAFVTVPRATQGTPESIRMTKASRGRLTDQSAHRASATSVSVKTSANARPSPGSNPVRRRLRKEPRRPCPRRRS
jgi:hypothetical protein